MQQFRAIFVFFPSFVRALVSTSLLCHCTCRPLSLAVDLALGCAAENVVSGRPQCEGGGNV